MTRLWLLKSAVLILIVSIACFGWWFATKQDSDTVLPVFGQKDTSLTGSSSNNSYHQIAAFSLIDQKGNRFTNENLRGKIYVADFFFANCMDICPIMSSQMERVYQVYSNEPMVCFVSHTVDPKRDTVEALAAYAERHHAAYGKWFFLTGEKTEIYKLARKSYLLSASEGDGGPNDFVHTQHFALIDTLRRIRGFYDGTDSSDVNRLIGDIESLLREMGVR